MTLTEFWNSYKDIVIPIHAGPQQRIETQRAFFAGARSMFEVFMACADNDLSDDDLSVAFNSIEDEIIDGLKDAGVNAEVLQATSKFKH